MKMISLIGVSGGSILDWFVMEGMGEAAIN